MLEAALPAGPRAPLPLALLLQELKLPFLLLLLAGLLHARGSGGLRGVAAVAPRPFRCWEGGQGRAAAPAGRHVAAAENEAARTANLKEANRHSNGQQPTDVAKARCSSHLVSLLGLRRRQEWRQRRGHCRRATCSLAALRQPKRQNPGHTLAGRRRLADGASQLRRANGRPCCCH